MEYCSSGRIGQYCHHSEELSGNTCCSLERSDGGGPYCTSIQKWGHTNIMYTCPNRRYKHVFKLTRHKGSLAGSCSILNVHNFIILFLSQIKWSWMAGGHNMEDLWGWRGPGFPTGPVDVHGGRSTKLHRGGQPPPADAASCWFWILITAGTGGCGIATRAPYIQPEIVGKINY